jgi:hypothetical protein
MLTDTVDQIEVPTKEEAPSAIPESLFGLVPDSGPVSYSRWINALRLARRTTLHAAPHLDTWWRFIRDKHNGKQFALSLGIPVARAFDLDHFVVKPRVGDSSGGLKFYSQHVCEERLTDERYSKLVAYKFYTFQAPKLICATNGPQYGYYLPDWTPVQPRKDPRPWLEVQPPSCLQLMLETAERVAREFPIPVRVDLYATDRGMYWGELSGAPGLRDKLTEEWDALMGQWYADYMQSKHGRPVAGNSPS